MIPVKQFTKQYSKKKQDNDKLQQDDIVKCMILDIKPYIEQDPSWKSSGMLIEIAIIARGRGQKTPDEKTVLIDSSGGIIPPKYNWLTSFWQPTPLQQRDAVSKNGVAYGDLMKEGGDTIAIGIKPAIKDLMPPVRQFDDANAEADRQESWNNLITLWNALDDKVAYTDLLEYSSSRLLLCHPKPDGTFAYIKPKPGVTFLAKVQYTGSEYYFYVNTFAKWAKDTTGKSYRPYYGDCDVYEPDEDQVIMAQLLWEHVQKSREEAAMRKLAKTAPPETDDEEPW